MNIGLAEYRPAWQAGWELVEIVAIKNPGGWLDRVFGGNVPVYIVKTPRGTFATRGENLREV